MTIRLIEGRHLTATNKKHIGDMIAQGMMNGRTAYAISKEGNAYRVSIKAAETDMNGRRFVRETRVLVAA